MFKVITITTRRTRETWETVGHWAERPNGDMYWHVDQYVRCLKVESL